MTRRRNIARSRKIAPPPPPVIGEVFADTQTVVDAIAEDPESYPTGTPVYLTDDGSGSGGWAVVYEGVPVNVTYDTVEDFEQAIITYDIPPGATTYIIDGGGGGSSNDTGWVINDEGTPTPIAPSLTTCNDSASVEYESMDRGAGSGSEGEPFDSADLISTPSIT